MKESLNVSIIQFDTYWENPVANRAHLEEIIAQFEHPSDLVLLPEMFTTGFTNRVADLAEPMNFTTHKWMVQMARQYKTAVCGSIIVKDGEKYFNRLLAVLKNGQTYFYDKKHLFAFGGENENYNGGKERLIIDVEGWKVCPLICYDLRFPVFSRNKNLVYDVLTYSASWPASRISVWNTLLMARAIENQSYVLAANRIGSDGNKLDYNGHSAIIDPKGRKIKTLVSNPGVLHSHLSKDELLSFREKFPAHLDADDFELK